MAEILECDHCDRTIGPSDQAAYLWDPHEDMWKLVCTVCHSLLKAWAKQTRFLEPEQRPEIG